MSVSKVLLLGLVSIRGIACRYLCPLLVYCCFVVPSLSVSRHRQILGNDYSLSDGYAVYPMSQSISLVAVNHQG